MRTISALIKKELLQMARDLSSFLIGIVLPLILLFIYGYGISLDIKHLNIALLAEDTSPIATSFVQSLQDSTYFHLYPVSTFKEATEKITRGEVRGIVTIPSYFSQYLERSDEIAPVQVIADGSEPNTALFVQNYVQGAFSNWLQIAQIQPPALIQLAPRVWYNEELISRNFLIPGSIAIIMTLIGTLLTALVVAREWERGTMEALLTTPVTRVQIIIGKLVPYFLLGLVSMTLCVCVAILFYKVPMRGSFLALLLSSCAFLFTAIALGLLISIVSKNQFVASQISIITGFLPAFMLSGFIFEISSMPYLIQLITHIIPARYFVSCLQTIFLVGDVWDLLLPNIGAIVLLGAIVLTITLMKFKRRLD